MLTFYRKSETEIIGEARFDGRVAQMRIVRSTDPEQESWKAEVMDDRFLYVTTGMEIQPMCAEIQLALSNSLDYSYGWAFLMIAAALNC